MSATLQVLMPVYNAEEFLEEAVESVLSQSLVDFEFLIVDDASTDGTKNILRGYAKRDARIRLIENVVNQGIIETRNQLFTVAEADYVALMDSDDICHPDRLKLQLDFLRENPAVAAVGCGIEHFGERNGVYVPPQAHNRIMAALSLGNAMLNPGVTVRRTALQKHNILCDPNYRGAADYDMWLRLGKVERLANLPQVLFKYRNHQVQESSANKLRQQSAHLRLVGRELKLLGVEVEGDLLRALIWPLDYWREVDVVALGQLVNQVLERHKQGSTWWGEADTQELFKMWDYRYRGVCRRHGLNGLLAYVRTRGLAALTRGKNMGVNFALDCVLRTT